MKRNDRRQWRRSVARRTKPFWQQAFDEICKHRTQEQVDAGTFRHFYFYASFMTVVNLGLYLGVFTAIVGLCLLFAFAGTALGGFGKLNRRKLTAAKMHTDSDPDYTDDVKQAQSKRYFLL